MSNWLKAGLIGAAAVVVLSLVDLIPCAGCITWILGLVLFGCVGALAAYWMPPVRMAGPAAGQGALAALISSAVGGAIGVVIKVGGTAVLGPAQLAALRQIPEVAEAWRDAGIDPGLLMATSPASAAMGGGLCCLWWIAIAVGLGALGGLIFASIRSE